MAALVLLSILLLAMSTHSGATYCICKDGVSDQIMQKAIDYACGSGADCTGILLNGACYSPNTIKNHCDYAVNNYFQRKSEVNGSCDFAGTAVTSATVPTLATGCVYPSSSQAATTSTGTSTGTSSGTSTGTSTGTSSGSSTGTTPTTTTSINSTNPTYSLGPTSTTGTGYDPNSATVALRRDASAKSLIVLIMPPMLSLIWGF